MYNVVKLLNSPKRENAFGQSALHFSVKIGDFNLTKELLQKGANVNAKDAFENTPLSLACVDMPNKVIVKLLLHWGAEINFERKMHMHLFLECVLSCRSQEHLDIIKLLIDRGANVNLTDSVTNRSCMHLVAITGNSPLANLLITNGAVLDIRDNFNFTPVQIAKIHGNYNLLTIFEFYLSTYQL